PPGVDDHFAASENRTGAQTLLAGAPVSALLGGRVEGVDDVCRDTSARRHVVPVAPGPFADRCALLAVDRPTTAARAGTPPTATPDATAGCHPLLQITA